MPKKINTILLIGCTHEFFESYASNAKTFEGALTGPVVISELSAEMIGTWWTKRLAPAGFIEAVVSQAVGLQYALHGELFHPSQVNAVLVDSAFIFSDCAAWQLKVAFENATFFQVWNGAINDSNLWHYVNTKNIEPLNERFPWREIAGQELRWARDTTYGDILQMTSNEIVERSPGLSQETITKIRKILALKEMYLRGEYEIMRSYR